MRRLSATGADRADALGNKYAWLVSSTWDRLHYAPGVTFDTWRAWWDHDDHEVTAVCGRTIQADLPGWFSRMGGTRCADCCRALGIPRGDGAPVNDMSLRERAS